uniref:Uncharacterized protein n=1 Tax=Amphimedon queenslandica TaxID=400682 RepID=A0A1X7UEB7_AMPQE
MNCCQFIVYIDGISLDFSTLLESLQEVMNALESIENNTLFRGRPCLHIEADQLQFFSDSCFRVEDIAEMYHCSKHTI